MLRKAIIGTLSLLILGFTLVALWPIGTPAPASTPILLPTVALTPAKAVATTPVLPACEYEDGSGQDVCMWDADTMGNGEGTDAIAGECSIESVGKASTACIALWNASPDGPAMVGECTDIEFEASQHSDMRKGLNARGWNLTECFKAMM